jgi:hypothetical protein
MYVVDNVHYPSEKEYHEIKAIEKSVREMVEKAPEKYPPCPFDAHWDLSCDCARVDIIHYDRIGCPHDVSVSMAAIGQVTQIRQYGFEGHDSSFDDFQDKFVETNYPDDPALYVKWVAENQPAVQWALDFANLRSYL